MSDEMVRIPGISSLRLLPDEVIPPQVPAGNLASDYSRRLIRWINKFNKSLDEEHEVGVHLVSFGQTHEFHLNDIDWWDPSLISFRGFTTEGDPVELIQHVTQINILLMKLPKRDPDKPKKPLGFAPKGDDG